MAENNDFFHLLLLIVAIVLLLPVLMMVLAWPMMGLWGGGHMWDGGMRNGTGGPELWLVMWMVPLVIFLGGGYLLYRAVTRPAREETDAALGELRLAYARGELSDEEFDQRHERLRRETDS